MVIPEQHLNKYDVPAVWAVVAIEKFFQLPWPNIAAFFATVYTVARLIQFLLRWYRGRK